VRISDFPERRHFVGFGVDPFGEANKNVHTPITQVAGVGKIRDAQNEKSRVTRGPIRGILDE
jgi:hypothetical protein